jgi:hypothetical protein
MIVEKKTFTKGAFMMIIFVAVLISFFSPLLSGQNGLEYLDDLYNSISKGSAYYIPKVKAESEPFMGTSATMKLDIGDKTNADQTALLFQKAGAATEVTDQKLKITGDLGQILDACLTDADSMYHNNGKIITEKYGYNEKQVLYNWWNACKEMDKDLKRQKKFKEANVVSLLQKKAIETSYNYYTIEPQNISDRLGVVIFSLIFYVIYTIWYGFSIMYLFEGWGLLLEDH